MTEQYALFGGELPHVADSVTSKAAASDICAAAATLRSRVLELLIQGPKTDEEMQLALEMNPSTQRPRRVELVQMGLVEDSNLTKRTKSGRSAVLWILKVAP